MKRRAPPGLTLVELLVVTASRHLVGIMVPAVQSVGEAAGWLGCLGNLRQIGLAIQAYDSGL